jgi:Superfamily II DNA and RNA helicases
LNFEHFSFDPRISAGIKSLGYTTPTPIQQQAIPVVLKGRDVLGTAQTGTGKTAAFVLPILQRLTKGPLRRVRALIVAPTRELAEQIHQASVDLGKNTRLRSVTVYGGVSKNRQVKALQRGAEIVVACPGRLLDLANDRSIDLSRVEVLVLDEADRMCDMGFLPDIRRILKLVPARRQTLFFSATMPKDIRRLADSILKDPVAVQIGLIAPAKTVSHALYPVSQGLRKNCCWLHWNRRLQAACWSSPEPSIAPATWLATWKNTGIAQRHCKVTCRRISARRQSMVFGMASTTFSSPPTLLRAALT